MGKGQKERKTHSGPKETGPKETRYIQGPRTQDTFAAKGHKKTEDTFRGKGHNGRETPSMAKVTTDAGDIQGQRTQRTQDTFGGKGNNGRRTQ